MEIFAHQTMIKHALIVIMNVNYKQFKDHIVETILVMKKKPNSVVKMIAVNHPS